MKTFFTLFLLFTLQSYAQTISYSEFQSMFDDRSAENKQEFLLNKGFSKETDTIIPQIQFTKKKFIKKTQDFEYEIITFKKDTVIYFLNTPKQILNILKDVKRHYYIDETSTPIKNAKRYIKRDLKIIVQESKELFPNSNNKTNFTKFTYFFTLKK